MLWWRRRRRWTRHGTLELGSPPRVGDPPDFASGRHGNFLHFLLVDLCGFAQGEMEALPQAGEVFGQALRLGGDVAKDESAGPVLFQLPFPDEVPMGADADKVAHESGGEQ